MVEFREKFLLKYYNHTESFAGMDLYSRSSENNMYMFIVTRKSQENGECELLATCDSREQAIAECMALLAQEGQSDD
jgi:hypothetical protein